jgi:hypothetical protein
MFQDFIQRKIEEYSKQIPSVGNEVSLQKLRQSDLPPYIINFFDQSAAGKSPVGRYAEGGVGNRGKDFLAKQEFEKTLRNAVVFNINYVIKPKATLLKFLFGNTDARPADYIIQRLAYFQFYRYYVDAIIEFIQLHQPPVISISQIEKILDEINKKIFAEVTDENSSDTQRLNLIKLLYHFFIDLSENNPINIKLPKKILSSFFHDKKFNQLKKKTDAFFKDDIFIQEAVDLMKKKVKGEKETGTPAAHVAIGDEKSLLLDTEVTTREIDKTATRNGVSSERSEKEPSYSEELIQTASPMAGELAPSSPEEMTVPETPEQRKQKIQDELFCEPNYRKKILKKLFRRNEREFNDFVFQLFDITTWESASDFIDDYFAKNKIDYLSEEAVKFVDIMENYFTK